MAICVRVGRGSTGSAPTQRVCKVHGRDSGPGREQSFGAGSLQRQRGDWDPGASRATKFLRHAARTLWSSPNFVL
jgi:hypothetical protein